MSFHAPEWFFLLPLLAVAGWRFRSLKLYEPVRAAALLVLVAMLADPRMKIGGTGLDLWVFADRSDSAAAVTAAEAPEVSAILERSKRSDDHVYYVDFAVDAIRRDQGDPVFRGGSHMTRTGAALEFALAQIEEHGNNGRASRMLLLGDGYATEPLGDVAEKVLRSGVPLDYRFTGAEQGIDFRIQNMTTPGRVLPGEAYLVEFTVTGRGDADVPWELVRGGEGEAKANKITGVARVRDGMATVRLTDRSAGDAGGAVRYEAHILPTVDAHPENNQAQAWVEVSAGPRAILLTNYPDDPLAALLRAQGFKVDVAASPESLSAASLTGARVVIINNVPAFRISQEFLDALDFFVREQGGGLLMAGGENSFGAGGYFSSSVDPLLPVSMELRKEHRRLATAMAIVMDRSGSMAASAGGGQTKMDLANTGAARAIELLGDYDAVAVFAVDSSAHQIVPLAEVGPNRGAMIRAVRRVASEGGGIFVGEGLRAGWGELQKAKTGQRHLILFADAADAEEPDDYKKTLAEMRKEGATVSVIGMGTRSDSDAALLEEVAMLGGGRCFFGATASDLPAIFAQETVSVARSAFVKETTGAQGTPGWAEVAARVPKWLAAVDGYNLSYLKPGATASLVTTDEYTAPLVATWSRGAGRVAAVSFALGGKYSVQVRGWSGLGDFEQTLTRWLAGEDVPPGLGLRTTVSGGAGGRLTLDLFYDESWANRVARAAPEASLSEIAPNGKPIPSKTLVWERMAPGHFRATTELTPEHMVRGVARIGGVPMAFGPITTSGVAEWDFDRARLQELRQLAARSGGVERLDLATIWDAPRPASTRSIRIWLLAGWLALVLIDAALTRLDIPLAPRRWKE